MLLYICFWIVFMRIQFFRSACHDVGENMFVFTIFYTASNEHIESYIKMIQWHIYRLSAVAEPSRWSCHRAREGGERERHLIMDVILFLFHLFICIIYKLTKFPSRSKDPPLIRLFDQAKLSEARLLAAEQEATAADGAKLTCNFWLPVFFQIQYSKIFPSPCALFMFLLKESTCMFQIFSTFSKSPCFIHVFFWNTGHYYVCTNRLYKSCWNLFLCTWSSLKILFHAFTSRWSFSSMWCKTGRRRFNVPTTCWCVVSHSCDDMWRVEMFHLFVGVPTAKWFFQASGVALQESEQGLPPKEVQAIRRKDRWRHFLRQLKSLGL